MTKRSVQSEIRQGIILLRMRFIMFGVIIGRIDERTNGAISIHPSAQQILSNVTGERYRTR